MRAFRALRTLNFTLSSKTHITHLNSPFLQRFYGAEAEPDLPTSTFGEEDVNNPTSVFDSSQYTLKGLDLNNDLGAERSKTPTWDEKYREKVNRKIFGESSASSRILKKDDNLKKKNAAELAMRLLDAALEQPYDGDEEEEKEVRLEDQRSLAVGIIGPPNAGKSALTNCMVGTKVAAVSRKTNTTTHEVVGVATRGNTQICFFDTPGLMLKKNGFPYNDIKVRNESAWGSVGLFDVLMVMFDVDRHLTRPDSRVVRLIERLGSGACTTQKRVLCINKIDKVKKKKDLLNVAEEFKDLKGYDRHFMISGLKGLGVKDLTQYLIEQAVQRPWDEDPFCLTEEVMKRISLEVVREKLLDHTHQEIPYLIEHRLMDWKELRDGSLRIEQHFITHKKSRHHILVGKRGSKIGRIGLEANEELRSIFKRVVHLILIVKVK